MPKNSIESTKRSTIIGLVPDSHKQLIAKKAKDQPLTEAEYQSLLHIHNEAVNRLKRTIELITQLNQYVLIYRQSHPNDDDNVIDFKDLLSKDNSVSDEIRHSLKMMKRHFCVDIRAVTPSRLFSALSALLSIITETYYGLSAKDEDVSISNISRKKQQENKARGYVWNKTGNIYLDFRLLTSNPLQAMVSLLHEAFHRYGKVNDHGKNGYYHYQKAIKQTEEDIKNRRIYYRYVSKLTNTDDAMNNADTIAHFCADLTGFWLHDINKLPAWWDTTIARQHSNQTLDNKSATINTELLQRQELRIANCIEKPHNVSKFGLFAVATVIVAGVIVGAVLTKKSSPHGKSPFC